MENSAAPTPIPIALPKNTCIRQKSAWTFVLQAALRTAVAVSVLLVAMVAPVAIVGAIPELRSRFSGTTQMGPYGQVMTAVGIHALIVVLVALALALLVHYWDKTTLDVLRLRPTAKGVVWFTAMLVLAALIALVAQLFTGGLGGYRAPAHLPACLGAVAALSSGFFAHAIPEELVFRGWLLHFFRFRPCLGLFIVTATFAGLHLVFQGGGAEVGEQLAYLTMPLGFGFAAGAVRLKTANLWPAIGLHGGFYLGNFLVSLFAASAPNTRTWIFMGIAWFVVGLAIKPNKEAFTRQR